MRDIFQKTILDSEVISSFNVPVLLEDVEVTVYQGGTYGTTNVLATIYRNSTSSTQGPSTESGATGGPNPFFTGPSGLAEFWTEFGFYDVVISDTHVPARIPDRVIQWNSVSGADGGIPGNYIANDTITTAELASSTILDPTGVNETGVVRRGQVNIPGEETRTNTAYGLLTTADRIQNVVLPNNGRIEIVYDAMVKASVASAGRVAIFIGANQLKSDQLGTAPAVQEITTSSAANVYRHFGTYTQGLLHPSSSTWTGSVTTGQAIGPTSAGGACVVFAAAGTYDISIQYKASSGSISAKERRLWVKAESY